MALSNYPLRFVARYEPSKASPEFGHIYLNVFETFPDDGYHGTNEAVRDLTIVSQWDRRSPGRIGRQPDADGMPTIYGWGVEYRNVFSLDLREAETKVKTLRAIDRKYRALCERIGRPETFFGYVRYVADVLGITTCTFYHGHKGERIPEGDTLDMPAAVWRLEQWAKASVEHLAMSQTG